AALGPTPGGSTGKTHLTHFHNTCSVPARRESSDDHPPCSRAYYGMATLQHDPGPYDDKNTWQAGDSLKPDYRLSRMTRADREAVWDTVTLPRRAQRQYEERRHEQLHGRAHLVGRYDGTPSTSSFREDNPARRGAHGRRVYDTQVRPEPLPPAISGIDTVPVEGILRRQESEFEKGLRDRGLGPGFRQYMPRANEPRSKYHNMATR
ncbi:hypothetical protein FOZ63_014381, partial [Perkinsus olseni]